MKQEIPEHIKQLLEKTQTENAVLRARLHTESGKDQLLTDIAESLLLADLASDPKASSPIDNQKVSGSRERPEPGSNVRAARRARRTLRINLEDAVKRFHMAAENGWRTPRRDVEQRRCRNRKCEALDKRIPKFVGPRGSRIELVNCPVCDQKLGEA